MSGFAIRVEFLTGRYVATAYHDRNAHEWPPHPARLFSAMTAEYHAVDEADPDERTALEWLERQAPPMIDASSVTRRSPATVYVPVNDTSVIGLSSGMRAYEKLLEAKERLRTADTQTRRDRAIAAVASARVVTRSVTNLGRTNPDSAGELLPSGRPKQARTFPSVTPSDPVVLMIWPDSQPSPADRRALTVLLTRVTRLGHSSSLVHCQVVNGVPEARFVPDIDGSLSVRTAGRGQLAALERRWQVHQGLKPRTLPSTATAYVDREDRRGNRALDAAESVFANGEWFLFTHVDGRKEDGHRSVHLARAIRSALMSAKGTAIPGLVSGHDPDGRPASDPHLAVLPLPFVRHRHATGLVLGFALLLPARSALLEGRDALLEAIGRWEKRWDDGTVHVHMEGGRQSRYRRDPSTSLDTLRSSRWTGPAKKWVSATPIALDRHPGALGKGSPARQVKASEAAAATIAASCTNVGLPEPRHVQVSLAPLTRGSRHVAESPPFRSGGLQKALLHAEVAWDRPVEGPVLLGAGRYFGLGLMTPVRDD